MQSLSKSVIIILALLLVIRDPVAPASEESVVWARSQPEYGMSFRLTQSADKAFKKRAETPTILQGPLQGQLSFLHRFLNTQADAGTQPCLSHPCLNHPGQGHLQAIMPVAKPAHVEIPSNIPTASCVKTAVAHEAVQNNRPRHWGLHRKLGPSLLGPGTPQAKANPTT